jgi:hypothetical protein
MVLACRKLYTPLMSLLNQFLKVHWRDIFWFEVIWPNEPIWAPDKLSSLNILNGSTFFSAFEGTLLKKNYIFVQLDPQGLVDYFVLA